MAKQKNPASLTGDVINKVRGLFYTNNGGLIGSPQNSLKNLGKSLEHKILTDAVTIISLAFIGIAVFGIIIVLFIFILVTMNKNAYITPKDMTAGGGDIPVDCQGDPGAPPTATDILYSSDHKYAFPMTPFSDLWYGCNHWGSNQYATDIGFIGDTAAPPNPGRHTPIVAYTGGTIVNVTLNDSLGGKYLILQGSDGRYYYYAHQCQIYVKPGDSVTTGQVISASDNTGEAATTVEHLHFAINAPPLGDTFLGGGGNVCPAWDFKVQFNLDRCTEYCNNPAP
jgi:hypothetical protein